MEDRGCEVNAPSVRWAGMMAYDSARKRVVLFGGTTTGFQSTTLNDTWEYDGKDWTQIKTANAP